MTVQEICMDCLLNGKVIASCPIGKLVPIRPGTSLDKRRLEDEAKNWLTNNRIAFPPYEGIRFVLR